MDPKPPRFVSIVIPTWNRARTLPRVIDSVLAQTYPHFELIVSDNASSDNTRELIESYRRRDPRVSYVGVEINNGPVRNWIRGIIKAKANLVKVLFSDDTLDPQYLAQTVPLWDLPNPPRFAYVGFGMVGAAEAIDTKQHRLIQERSAAFLCKSLVMHGDVPVSLSAGLFHKEDLLTALTLPIAPPQGKRFDFLATGAGYDQAVYLYAAARADWIARLPAKLVLFGAQADSITIKTNRDTPGTLKRAYMWAQLRFVDNAYAGRPVWRVLLRLAVLAQLLKHNTRHHPWIVKLLPDRN